MNDPVFLSNRRRFPRARLNCDIVYRDRLQSWQSQTRDVSLAGCRVAGYYPFPPGKSLALKMTHPAIAESVAMVTRVVRLCGGAENSFVLAFDRPSPGHSKFEEWIRRLAAKDPNAQRTISWTPDQLPLEAQLRRAPRPRTERQLSQGEMALVQRLAASSRPLPLIDLRREWGAEWERKAKVVFDLIADGIILCSMMQMPPSASEVEAFSVERFFKTSAKLMKDLEGECGPLDKDFARELEAMTQEVTGRTGSGSQPLGSSLRSPVLKKRPANEERQPIVLPYSGRTKPS